VSEVDWAALVRGVLEAARLPQPAAITRALEGVGTHVFFAGEAVVRLGTGSDAVNFPRTVAILEAARDTVAVPRVLFADLERTSFPFPVVVLAYVPGVPMSHRWAEVSGAERIALLAQVVDQLSRLHRLDPASLGPAADFRSPWWVDRVSRIERLLPVARRRTDFPRRWVDDMAAYVDAHRDSLSAAQPACVLHNDVTWGNIIVHDERVVALIDFDDALAGPPEEDWWQLVFRTWESEPPVPLAIVRELHCLDDAGPEMLERLKISEIQAALELLSGELSWIDDETALAEARETYETAFMSTFFEDRFAQLL
jgi:aminoglycoside phosphotransferase (APT) family kinase protein